MQLGKHQLPEENRNSALEIMQNNLIKISTEKLRQPQILSMLVQQANPKIKMLDKGPVKLIKWVKIALLLLHVTSKLFQFMIFNLFGWFYIRLSK